MKQAAAMIFIFISLIYAHPRLRAAELSSVQLSLFSLTRHAMVKVCMRPMVMSDARLSIYTETTDDAQPHIRARGASGWRRQLR